MFTTSFKIPEDNNPEYQPGDMFISRYKLWLAIDNKVFMRFDRTSNFPNVDTVEGDFSFNSPNFDKVTRSAASVILGYDPIKVVNSMGVIISENSMGKAYKRKKSSDGEGLLRFYVKHNETHWFHIVRDGDRSLYIETISVNVVKDALRKYPNEMTNLGNSFEVTAVMMAT